MTSRKRPVALSSNFAQQLKADADIVRIIGEHLWLRTVPADGDQPETKLKPLNPIRLRQLGERCEELEAEIARCEADIAECEAGLVNFKSAEESIRLAQRLEARRCSLAVLLREWEEVAQTIEE